MISEFDPNDDRTMCRTPQDLYLDLLIRVLANTIYEDPSTHPDNVGPYQAQLRLTGKDWPKVAHTMVGVCRLRNLRDLSVRAIEEGVPGDFIEAGVWRGGCCILLRGVLAAYAAKDRRVYVADSFDGLPLPNPEMYPEDEGYNLRLHEQLAVPLETVKENFSRYGLLDEQVVFVEGLFKDTLPALQDGPFALIRLDGDLYESTYGSLKALYPQLSPGGFIIVDDVNFLPPCARAVKDFRESQGITAPMHRIDWSSSWWRKE